MYTAICSHLQGLIAIALKEFHESRHHLSIDHLLDRGVPFDRQQLANLSSGGELGSCVRRLHPNNHVREVIKGGAGGSVELRLSRVSFATFVTFASTFATAIATTVDSGNPTTTTAITITTTSPTTTLHPFLVLGWCCSTLVPLSHLLCAYDRVRRLHPINHARARFVEIGHRSGGRDSSGSSGTTIVIVTTVATIASITFVTTITIFTTVFTTFTQFTI
jgi:hypothetical protein